MHIPNEALIKINDKSISNRPALQKLGKLCQHVEAEGQSFSDRALPEAWKVSVTSIGKPGFSIISRAPAFQRWGGIEKITT